MPVSARRAGVRGLTAELERTVAELRLLEARGRRFVADISHELRTPLAAMTAVTDVLDLEEENGDALHLISEGTGRPSGPVNDLMEMARFDAGAAEPHRNEIVLAESVRCTLASRQWRTRWIPGRPGRARCARPWTRAGSTW